jgi:phosphatidylglycerophosphatase A
MNRLAVFLATAGGAGFFPVAPGTVGSLVAVLLYLVTRSWPLPLQASLLLAISLAGIWAGTRAAAHFGRPDPGEVVIDEVAGQLLTLLATGVTGWGLVLAFVIFRALDIAKPWPARRLEHLHGGLGIMADDLMVAVYGNLIVRAAQAARPGVF